MTTWERSYAGSLSVSLNAIGILKPTGSMYLHIDHTAHAYAKAMMDAIFGRKNFRNEIVWAYKKWTASKKTLPRNHDIILFYTKSDAYTWTPPMVPNDDPNPSQYVSAKDKAGKTVTAKDDKGKPLKRALSEEIAIADWWAIPMLSPVSKERTGYPTQKPLSLYERIVKASSNKDDVVLDPFAGCATTCVAAERLGRKWIGIDINEEATGVIRDRLQGEVSKSMAWKTLVKTPKKPPKRTDGGAPAAPELRVISRKRNARRWSVKEVRETLLGENGQRCQGCGWEPPYPDYLQIDHKKPRSLGGADEMDNYTLLCDPCNRLKSNKLTLNEASRRSRRRGARRCRVVGRRKMAVKRASLVIPVHTVIPA